MSTNELINNYKELYNKVEVMISNIAELGLYIKPYENELSNIEAKVKQNNIENQNTSNLAKGSYEITYLEGINKLNSLKKSLEQYDKYYKILNSSNLIEMRIKKSNISVDELNKYVSKMIYNIKLLLNNSETESFDNKKQIEEKVYKTAYELIKAEILMKGESDLYLFCKSEKVDISYFDKLIKKEINPLDFNNDNYEPLKMKIYEIKGNGLYNNYFDIGLIKILLAYTCDSSIKERFCKRLDNIIEEIKESKSTIINSNMKQEYRHFNQRMNDNKSLKNKIKIRIGSVALLTTLLVSGSLVIHTISKKRSEFENYKKTTEIYSTIDGNTKETEEIISRSKGVQPSDKVSILYFSEDNNPYTREYHYLDVSKYEFEKLEDYYNYGIENYDENNSEQIIPTKEPQIISDYKDPYAIIERETYKDEGSVFDYGEYMLITSILYFAYIILIIIAECAYMSEYKKSIIKGNIKTVLEEIKELQKDNKNFQEAKEEIKQKTDEILMEINKYEELQNKFNQLFEENKYLIEDEEELQKRFNDVVKNNYVSNVKEMIMKNNSKFQNNYK